MSKDHSATTLRRASVALTGLALVATAALASAPAQASARSAAGPAVVTPKQAPCLHPQDRDVPAARRIADTSPVTPAVMRKVQSTLRTARSAAASRGSTVATAPVYRVNVQIHIIQGTRKKDRTLSKRGARRKVFRILRNAYNGGESPMSTPMGIDFRLKRITITRNNRWYRAEPMSRADVQMKQRLHRGSATTLNIYVNKPANIGGSPLLGYSRFPWQYGGRRKKLDGVTVSVRSLPGGNLRGYNQGDTVVHETGHWLGLLHTFQGGCSEPNDYVADTPAEADPNYTCSEPVAGIAATWTTRECDPAAATAGGLVDPSFNFMDYSLDGCMRMFTAGQRARVDQAFAAYRYGRR